MLGGALGNGVSLLAYGQVTDFIGLGGVTSCNIADILILCGMTYVIIGMISQGRWEMRRRRQLQQMSNDSILAETGAAAESTP